MSDTNADFAPTVLVIVGVTGDLAGRKVLPAIYHLIESGLLHPETYIIGTSRRLISREDVVSRLRHGLEGAEQSVDEQVMERVSNQLSTLQLDPNQQSDYHSLTRAIAELENAVGSCLNRLFYLSVPPQVYTDVVACLGRSGLNKGCQDGDSVSRLLIEKPFGFDLASAEQLIAGTAEFFDETQIFRIDHYLAKETAQNILTFRSRNPLFAQVWRREAISRIAISATETIGIEGRANFYDNIGALRDLIQSHLMQLLSLTLLDVPKELDAESVHAAKQTVLRSIKPIADFAQRSVRGQYASYREEVDDSNSTTETFASVILFSSDPEWQGVPLQLTTGKALREKHTSIVISFGDDDHNQLELRLQPHEGISLTLQVKKPGLEAAVETTNMDFTYERAFAGAELDDYERVLIEAIRGDRLLFTTDDEVLLSWRILEPLLQHWKAQSDDLHIYKRGSDGPDSRQLAVATDDH